MYAIRSYYETWSRNLAYGDQRRLEIARALATQPELLLLDEPAAGMNPQEIAGMVDLIKAIREQRKTIILIVITSYSIHYTKLYECSP